MWIREKLNKLWILACTFILPFYSFASHGNQVDQDMSKKNFKLGGRRDNLLHSTCSKLLELNSKHTLSTDESETEELLFELIYQISEQPIEYCEFNTAIHQIDTDNSTVFY